MDEGHENRVIIKTEKHVADQKSPFECVVIKKIKIEVDDTLEHDNLNIKHEEDYEMKEENERFETSTDIEGFQDIGGNFISPESFCEVSLEEKCFRCPICPYETNIKKYLKLHLASQTHAMQDRTKKMFDGYKKTRGSVAAQKFPDSDSEKNCEATNDRTPTCGYDAFDTYYESSLEKKKYKCSQCPYETDSRKCLNIHFSGQTHLFKSCAGVGPTSIDIYQEKDEDVISTVKAEDYELETLSRLQSIPQNFLCRICGYEATTRRSLDKHTERTHSPKNPKFILPKKPPLPKYKFERANNSRMKYVGRNSRNEKVSCVKCGYEAKDGIDLKVHNLKHRDITEVLTHRCKYCDGDGLRTCQIRKKRSAAKVSSTRGDS